MKIGIITMHKVLNCGSALQAYALQRKLNEMGQDSELIDYIYPPLLKSSKFQRIINRVKDFLMGSPAKKKRARFASFYRNCFLLSSKSYDKFSIKQDPPKYDVYMVGSDQVWNPKYCKGDSDFLLGFAPDDKPKLAFASSFATNVIPEELKSVYATYLKRFDYIAVRESYGCTLVKELAGEDAVHVCDPVILLNKGQWLDVAKQAINKQSKKPYILVYILSYMFNPYPGIDAIVKEVQKKLGYHVIYLEGTRHDLFKHNSCIKKNSGPMEFINLFANASFVITTSFHGAAFSSVFGLPFLGVVKDTKNKGDRIVSLLNVLDCKRSLVGFDESFELDVDNINDYVCKNEKLAEYREYSALQLNNMLKKVEMQ